MPGDAVNRKTEPHVLREREATLGFGLYVVKRIARCETVRIQVSVAVRRISEIADLDCCFECAPHQIEAAPDISRP